MSLEANRLSEYYKKIDHQINKKADAQSAKLNYEINHNYIIHIGICFLIYSLCFFGFFILKNRAIALDPFDIKLFLLFIAAMVVSAVFSKKLSHLKYFGYGTITGKLFFSLLISLTSLVVLFNLFGMQSKTPAYIIGATFFGLIIETFYIIFLGTREKREITFFKFRKASLRYFLLDFSILFFFCFIEIVINLITINDIELENGISLVILIFVSWLISAASTHNFLPLVVSNSKYNFFGNQLKFYLQFLVLIGLSMFSLNLEPANSLHFIKALMGYTFFSALIALFVFAPRVENKVDTPTQKFMKKHRMKSAVGNTLGVTSMLKYTFPNHDYEDLFGNVKIRRHIFKKYKTLYSALDKMIEINSFNPRKTLIIDSDDHEIEVFRMNDYFELFINMHVLNDQYDLNDYLRKVRKTLVCGGVFAGLLYPHQYRYKRFLTKHSFWIGNILYFFDIVWKRVFPKLPVTRRMYFRLRKEKDQAISLAEGLGRLVYTGYKIIDLIVVDDAVYFTAVKVNKPAQERKSFYSPIFKMERMGKYGKPIFVYKLRTMNPYSEFIQDFVFQNNHLQEGGKFKDDFRIPGWGKFLRKTFLDELPMLFNWFRGDLKLVGVRPISNQYLSLYKEAHQERRKKFKPGLFPPFYVDLPNTIEEIEESESRYLDAYEKNPVKTDFVYLLKIFKNIVFKKKRSN